MRQGLTIVPAGLVLVAVAAMVGAGGEAEAPRSAAGANANAGAWLDDRFGQPVAPIYLLLRPDVQRDLQLDARQVAGARDQVGQLIERLLRVRSRGGQAVMTERRKIDEAMAAWLRRELSARQLERLTQISLQWEGVSATHRPSVVEYLGLVEPQRAQIDRMLADRERRRVAGTLTPSEFDALSRDTLAVLNPVQRQQWDGLLGEPCRFSIGRPAGPPRDPAAVRTSGTGTGAVGRDAPR